MKQRLLILCTAFIALSIREPALGASISYARNTWNHIAANVVYVNMNSPNVH